MVAEERPDADLRLDATAFTLLAAWRSGRRYIGRRLNTAGELETALRGVCADTGDRLQRLDYRKYSPDMLLEVNEFTSVPRARVAQDSSVLELLHRGAGLDHLPPGDLVRRQIAFYSALLGDDPENRTAYVAKHNPARMARGGGIISLGRDVLRYVDDPIFIFDPDFDLIIDDSTVFIFEMSTFELLFRDAPEVIAAVGTWIADITATLPFYANGADALRIRCEQDSRLRRRLLAIRERGHLRGITVDDIAAEVVRLGRDPDAYIRDGALVYDDADPAALLYLLNEDLFLGGLSNAGFQAQRKTAT